MDIGKSEEAARVLRFGLKSSPLCHVRHDSDVAPRSDVMFGVWGLGFANLLTNLLRFFSSLPPLGVRVQGSVFRGLGFRFRV